MNNKITVINSEKSFFKIDIEEIINFKHMIYYFTLRDLQTVYMQTILGPIWLVLIPLISSSMYTLIFGVIAKMPTDGIDQFIFFYTGTIFFSFFSTNFSRNSNLFNSYANLMKMIYFPRIVIPISTFSSNYFSLSISFIFFMFIYFFVFNQPITINILLIPFMLIYLSIVGCCLGMIFSCLTYKYKDLSNTVGLFSQLALYISPIVYPVSAMPNVLQKFSLINPIAYPIAFLRDLLFEKNTFDIYFLYSNFLVGLILIIFSYFLFNYFSKIFQDVV